MTLKMANCNHDNSKNFDTGFGLDGRKVYQLSKLLERDIRQLWEKKMFGG